MFNKVQKILVTDDYVGQRIDNYLINLLKGVPKSKIYSIIRKGEVRINGSRKKPSYKLVHGNEIRIPPLQYLNEKSKEDFIPTDLVNLLKDRIIYENDDYLAINKPEGIASHGGSGIKIGLIETIRNFGKNYRECKLIHRLDKDTSGCQIVSKKQSFLRKCNEEIRQGKSFKEYLVIVHGEWPSERKEISSYLIKTKNSRGENYVKENEDGKKSVSKFKVIKHSKNITKLSCNIITGRTHQIRVHCSSVGNFVIGDVKYGNREMSKFYKHFGRMFLHSHRLEIPGLSLSICAEEPESFKKILKFDETL